MQQSSLSLRTVIDQVSQEKGIDPKVLVEATEQAILTAAKRTFGIDRELEARFNDETGTVDLFQYMTVVEEVDDDETEISYEAAQRYGLEAEIGEELGFQIFYLDQDYEKARQQDKDFGDLLQLQSARQRFGRIAAQTAKQVIMQKVRDAERDRIFDEFKNRKGELITGIVRRFERGSNIIVGIGQSQNVEAILPAREQAPRENYRPGDRIVALLKDIDREAKGPQIILSRTDVGLLVKLFEMEVPEIYEGIVRIVAASREPGARSKIAVSSRDADVDPVGACVGMKGSRVQAVVQELRGEKIDIVPFDRDPARFVCNAIAPAEVIRVVIDEGNATMELVVPDSKLSLAIGRRGQNVRLASQLTGWKLDIVSEARFKQNEEEAMRALARIEDEELARNLYNMGFRTLDEVAEAPLDELAAIEGIGPTGAEQARTRATSAMEDERQHRLKILAESSEMPSDRDRLQLVRGVSASIAQKIVDAGYGSPEAVRNEEDGDRFALSAKLQSAHAAEIREAVEVFLDREWPPVEAAIRANFAKEQEVARAEQKQQDEKAAQEAEAAAATTEEAQSTQDAQEAPDTE